MSAHEPRPDGQAEAPAPLLLLAGPTAVGKSAVALCLAERVGGEIVSVDSMQVYRGLDIGTAKPSPAERRRIPHHGIDVASLTESFDAARFVELAREAVAAIRARGRVPILCGGTGLYFRAFLEGLGDTPAADPGLRALLEATPLPELRHELELADPAAFAVIGRGDLRRLVRAVEVFRLTGRPHSAQRAVWSRPETGPAQTRALGFGLNRAAADLHRRIESRVDRMFEQGLVNETRQRLEEGLALNRTALQAIGYRQVAEFLRGERSLPATIELVKARTRQFAKRQLTWFRTQASLTWTDLAPEEPPDQVADRLATLWAAQHLHPPPG